MGKVVVAIEEKHVVAGACIPLAPSHKTLVR